MASADTLNIFYEEPDPDRWIWLDRYPRKIIRRIVRGRLRPGGVMMVALELMRGLDKVGIPYRFNDYKYLKKNREEIACVIGKPHILDKFKYGNPIIFGAGVFSHPSDYPDLLTKYSAIKKILVPGPWMKDVFVPYYGHENVEYWPVGIDTEKWNPDIKKKEPSMDFLIYDKIRWDHEEFNKKLIKPIIEELDKRNLSYDTIRYGHYTHAQLSEKLAQCRAVIFLCEHETQGLAYQQILATGTPILAWDRGGAWQDPSYYPHRVIYEPVTSVPYWDNHCGEKFEGAASFPEKLNLFVEKLSQKTFAPEQYIHKNLTLEKCALDYYRLYGKVKRSLE